MIGLSLLALTTRRSVDAATMLPQGLRSGAQGSNPFYVSKFTKGRVQLYIDILAADRINPLQTGAFTIMVSDDGVNFRQYGGFTWQGNTKAQKTPNVPTTGPCVGLRAEGLAGKWVRVDCDTSAITYSVEVRQKPGAF